jgi:hypothetical protein
VLSESRPEVAMGFFGRGKPNVQKLAAKRKVQDLIRALEFQADPSVCKAAALALGELRDPAAREPLLRKLRDYSNSALAGSAARALARFRDPSLTDHLMKAYDERNEYSSSYDVSSGVIEALAEIADPRAVNTLVTALENRSVTVREAAASALEQFGVPDDRRTQVMYLAVKRQWQKLVPFGSAAVDTLAMAVREADRYPRTRDAQKPEGDGSAA